MIFVDANAFHHYIFRTKYTEQIADLFKRYPDLATSVGVLDEVYARRKDPRDKEDR